MASEGDDESIVNHVGQATADLERAIAFYTVALGFTVERRFRMPEGPAGELLGIEGPLGLEVAYLRLGSFVLELMQFNRDDNPERAERVFNEPGLTHLSISVDDLAAATRRTEAQGGTVVTRLPNAVMIRDPDGQILELLTMDYRRQVDAHLAARDES